MRPPTQLEEPAALGPDVQTLPLQREDREVPSGTLCRVAGWGVTKNTGQRPDKLQSVDLPVMSRARCNERAFYDGDITEKLMCAESRRKDSCKVRPFHRGGGFGFPISDSAARSRCVCKRPAPFGRALGAKALAKRGANFWRGCWCRVWLASSSCPHTLPVSLQGDSGGPLICNGVAEGVVATGSRVCGNWKKPGIYTRIPPYLAWINSVMGLAN